jgi:hypothetical protein
VAVSVMGAGTAFVVGETVTAVALVVLTIAAGSATGTGLMIVSAVA